MREVVSWGLGLGGWWFSWEASHSPVPPTDVVCAYAIQTMESAGHGENDDVDGVG